MKSYILKTVLMLPVMLNMFVWESCSDEDRIADAYGNFEADEVLVSAQSQGSLLFLDAREGEVLEKNKLAGLIDTTDAVIKQEQIIAQLSVVSAKMQNLEAQLKVQEEQGKNLEREVNRIKNLLEDKAATQQQYDDITGKLNVHQLQTTALESQKNIIIAERSVLYEQLAEVRNYLDKCRIVNPVSGRVLEIYSEAGELVTPGKAIYKIANLEEMELKFYISGDQLASIALGDSILVAVDMPGGKMETIPGTVTWISSEVEFTPKIIQTREERVNMVYAAKLRVKNDGSLKIGMPGEVLFIRNEE